MNIMILICTDKFDKYQKKKKKKEKKKKKKLTQNPTSDLNPDFIFNKQTPYLLHHRQFELICFILPIINCTTKI